MILQDTQRRPVVFVLAVVLVLAALAWLVRASPVPSPMPSRTGSAATTPCVRRPECRAAARVEMAERCRLEGREAIDIKTDEEMIQYPGAAFHWRCLGPGEVPKVPIKGEHVLWPDGPPRWLHPPCRLTPAECFEIGREEMRHGCKVEGREAIDLPDDETMAREDQVYWTCKAIDGAPDNREKKEQRYGVQSPK